MYVYYIPNFAGKLIIHVSPERPNPKPLSGQIPQYVQEVTIEDHHRPLGDLEQRYPPQEPVPTELDHSDLDQSRKSCGEKEHMGDD